MSLKSELKAELKTRNIAFKDLNKKANKTAKEEILARLTRRGIVEGYSKERLAKELRDITVGKKKLTFSNELIRSLYDRSAVNARKVNPAKLRGSAKPKPSKIQPTKRKSGHAIGAYFYIIKGYLKEKSRSKKHKTKRIPKRAIKLTNDDIYQTTQDFVIISEDILSRKEVLTAALNQVLGAEDESLSDISFNASGLTNIDFKVFDLVAIEYRAVVKDF